jgi:hypothetical protein
MVLKEILAISGEPGLFKFIAQGKNAIIVEQLETKKRSSAYASAKISSLDEISIFTEKEDVPLSKIFDLIHQKENGGAAIDYKADPEKIKAYFNEVLPDYDKDRVYVSDIKKVLHWYNILHALNMLVIEEPEKKEEEKPENIKTEPKKTKTSKKKPVSEDNGEKVKKKSPSKPKNK